MDNYLPSLPFKGLESFRYADREIFSEREEEKSDLVNLIQIYRGSMLFGQSGIGKSSLIAAGLIPLVKNNYDPEVIRVYPNRDGTFIVNRIEFTEKSGEYLPSIFDAFPLGADKSKINVALTYFEERIRKIKVDEAPEQKGSLLIFDQFEELITLFEESGLDDAIVKVRLQEEIIELLRIIYYDSSLRIKLLFVFREDYLAKFTKLFNALPDISDHFLRLTSIPDTQLENIINYPFVKDKGSRYKNPFLPLFSQKLAAALSVYFKGNVVLTEVQIVTLFLYKNDEKRTDWMKGTEPIKPILQQFYVDILDQFNDDEKEIAISILSILVLNERTRNIFHCDAIILEYLKQHNWENDNTIEKQKCQIVLKKLVDNNPIVRKETRTGGEYYEIKSEAIIPFINEKKIERNKALEFAKKRKKLILSLGLILASIFVAIGIAVYVQSNQQDVERQKMQLRAQQNYVTITAQQNQLTITAQQNQLALDAQKNQLELDGRKKQLELDGRKKQLDLEAQKKQLELDAQKNQLDLDAQKNQLDLDAQKKQLDLETQQKQLEYSRRLDQANSLAINSLNLSTNNLFQKSTLARLAYDTLSNFQSNQEDEVFISRVYEALINSLLPNFTNNTFNISSIKNGYVNMEGVTKSNNNYYITLPFESVIDKEQKKIINDANLVHAWVNHANTMLAIELIVDSNRTKKLVIRKLSTNTNVVEALLDINEDIVSLIFDKADSSCFFSTKFPYNGKKGKVCQLKINLNEKYSSIYECTQKNEYMFLVEKINDQFCGITNLGNFVQWNGSVPKMSVKPNLFVKGVTAISYDATQENLYVGYEDGRIYYKKDSNDRPELFSQGNENSKITSIASSTDGKWFAAGCITGRILLWKKDTILNEPAILPNNKTWSSNDAISGICFAQGDTNLVVTTRSGIIYLFPLSMKVMALKICSDQMYINSPVDWGKSDIPKAIKFKKACVK